MPLPLSLGKWRGLQQCATDRGAIAVMALDHRGNLRQLLNPAAPQSVSLEDMTAFKQQVVTALAPVSSAVLLDPEVGVAQCLATSALPGQVGLLVAVEATGYTGDPKARQSRILPGWSVAKAKRLGASAIKLLIYYHPDAPTAGEIEALVRQTAADCAAADLAFFLEPLSYSADPNLKTLPPAERRRVVIETARRLTPLGADVLKTEFPLDAAAQPDEGEWAKACAELSAVSVTPWVLLSASVDYATYLRQVTVACHAGATGVAVGRAVWQEAPGLTGEARLAFLRGPARERMGRLTELCDALARPWTAFYTAPSAGSDWYASYPGF
jgi:tagatose 1,6-diphosphate aldolase